MRHGLACLSVATVTIGLVIFTAQFSASLRAQEPEKAKDSASAPPANAAPAAAAVTAKPASAAERKNPVKATPEGIAAVKKIYGYDCAMCHGAAGDGKGDVAASMNLTMKDWRDPATLGGISDGDMFDIIVKGKDKMIGEGDRLPPEKAWNMVHYVRSFAKKESTAKEPAAPKS